MPTNALAMSGGADEDGTNLANALESEEKKAARLARLEGLAESLAKSRSEAIAARVQSGVEDDWRGDEEFYQGIDDANRGEHRSIWHTKPMGAAFPKPTGDTRSTVFPNITGPYCDAASARIADMLLPTDARGWAFGPTPIPDLVDVAKGVVPKTMQQQALFMHGGDQEAAAGEIAYAMTEAKRLIDEAKEKSDKAQKRVEDWHVECQYHSHVRTVIEDSARIGTGVLKGPIPMLRRAAALVDGGLQVQEKMSPGSKRISAWDFYPDGACGENIQNGSFTWERDRLTRKQLRELKKQPGYLKDNIDLCLDEGAHLASESYQTSYEMQFESAEAKKRNKFEIWYWHGILERPDLEAGGCDCSDMEDPNIPAMVTMVNNRVIRLSMNPLDTGSFPYDVMVWRPKATHWTGIGVARQIRTPQRIVVAATRHLMDNAGQAAGVMLAIDDSVLVPADGVLCVGPRKVFRKAEGADDVRSVKDAVHVIKIDMLVNELMEIIQLGLKLAEDVTGFPLLLQGQQGKAPDTVGGLQLLNNNASSVLRRLARLFDDRVTEPHVRRYYEWLLQYGEDDEKGDFQIDARGSSALVERDIQNQELAGMAKLTLDMRFGLDPRKWVAEYLRSRHFDPKRFEFDDEKWKKILEQMSAAPQNPSLAVAQLRAETEQKMQQLDQSFKDAQAEAERQHEVDQNHRDRALAMWVEEMELSGQSTISVDSLKTKLADTRMKLDTQVQLSAADKVHQSTLALAPPTEPKGRAKPGRAYQQ